MPSDTGDVLFRGTKKGVPVPIQGTPDVDGSRPWKNKKVTDVIVLGTTGGKSSDSGNGSGSSASGRVKDFGMVYETRHK